VLSFTPPGSVDATIADGLAAHRSGKAWKEVLGAR
jgi:hypothetical protein